MYRSFSLIGRVFHLGIGHFASSLALCLGLAGLGLSGCASFDSNGDGLSSYETSNWRDEIELPDARAISSG